MSVSVSWVRVGFTEGSTMNTLLTIVAFAVVFAVLAVAAYALFEVSPFARHAERFRDPRTGKRRGNSPRLD